MTTLCASLRACLADEGIDSVRANPEMAEHLEGCVECQAFGDALGEIDRTLPGLPPFDAPDDVATAAGRAPHSAMPDRELAPDMPAPPSGRRRTRVVVTSMGLLAAAIFVSLIVSTVLKPEDPLGSGYQLARISSQGVVGAPSRAPVGDEMAQEPSGRAGAYLDRLASLGNRADGRAAQRASRPTPRPTRPVVTKNGKGGAGDDFDAVGQKSDAERERLARPNRLRKSVPSEVRSRPRSAEQLPLEETSSFHSRFEAQLEDFGAVVSEVARREGKVRGSADTKDAAVAWKKKAPKPSVQSPPPPPRRQYRGKESAVLRQDPASVGAGDFAAVGGSAALSQLPENLAVPVPSALRSFWAERERTTGLPLQDPTGYWSNTYVPGDPAIRLLQARLQTRDLSALRRFSTGPLRLDGASRQIPQPFDAPKNSALSVFLHADRRGLQSESRVYVQVGLQGTNRFSGLRPAMNVGLVLDLGGELSVEAAASVRALVASFNQARDIGDRFTLVVAGKPGGVVVPADQFRHGTLAVALDRLLGGHDAGAENPSATLTVATALERAIEAVRADDDPTAPLGSSVVVLVTNRTLPDEDGLARMAHRSAVAGVPFSVVGVGTGVGLEQLDYIALAGQGHRRLLTNAGQAQSLVEQELSAVGRVVARAVRLRIRLAPGVELVDVLGSHRLDERRAERVREAEKSIDRRMERNLGIQADRGDDEAGIQIVIPSYYAGDAHVVLLDVIAPQPGPIAEVTVRFKDLVSLRNSVARDSLALGRATEPEGPLERNVLKNVLAFRLSDSLQEAGAALARGDEKTAAQGIEAMAALIAGIQHEVPGFQSDRDLAVDGAMLGEYLALLRRGAGQEHRKHLADSLRLAAWRKVQPPRE